MPNKHRGIKNATQEGQVQEDYLKKHFHADPRGKAQGAGRCHRTKHGGEVQEEEKEGPVMDRVGSVGRQNQAEEKVADPQKTSYCISCGDPIPAIADLVAFVDENPDVRHAMRVRCLACAREVLGIAIPFVGTLQHDCGGGRRVIRDTRTHG